MNKLRINTPVTWISSSCRKTGIIVAIIPAGKTPSEVNPLYKRFDDSMNRDHESYIVRGGMKGSKSQTLYWPRVSGLQPDDALTQQEIAWCQSHPKKIRRLISSSR